MNKNIGTLLRYITCPHQAQLKQNKSKKRGLFKRKISVSKQWQDWNQWKKFWPSVSTFIQENTIWLLCLPKLVIQCLGEEISSLISGLFQLSAQTFDTVPCSRRGGL